jgi:hypothetical protein
MSFYCHYTFSKIAVLACLISILAYSSSALSGGGKEKDWKRHHANGKMSIPENIRRAGQEKLTKPGTNSEAYTNNNGLPITNKLDDQQPPMKPVTPGYGAPGMVPNATQIRMLTREPDHPEKSPVKEMEKEASHHHAHHQYQPCDKENSKQGCPQYTPMQKDFIEDKL